MLYLYAKAVHIIFVICWMAGLFYMPRLFVYHTEARRKGDLEYRVLHQQFMLMENRLWWVITTPAMAIALLAGLLMLWLNPALLMTAWMQIKLCFVAGLVVYHFLTQRIMDRLGLERSRWTSTQLRLWNEVSTILLFAIVFLAVLKSAVGWVFGVLGIVGLGVLLMALMKVYKRYRKNKGEYVD
ncbi:MAG: protoporphyrinogen oxidase HemJ [Sphingobacterium sp.]